MSDTQNATPKKTAKKSADAKANYVNPVLSWCLFAGALVVAVAIALIVLL